MIRGVVGHMLHQVRQTQLCCANRKHFAQGFFCHGTYELRLFFLYFLPLQAYRRQVVKCVRMEQGVLAIPQIRQQCGAVGRRFPVGEPTPFAPDDMHESVTYRTSGATQIMSELLRTESGSRFENPVVSPAVILVEQLNVVLSHAEQSPCPISRNLTPYRPSVKPSHSSSGGECGPPSRILA